MADRQTGLHCEGRTCLYQNKKDVQELKSFTTKLIKSIIQMKLIVRHFTANITTVTLCSTSVDDYG